MNVPALKIKCPECGTEDKIKIPVILTGKDAGVLIVCEKCGEPASQCIIWDEDKGVTRIHYYCKKHDPKSENS